MTVEFWLINGLLVITAITNYRATLLHKRIDLLNQRIDLLQEFTCPAPLTGDDEQ